MRDDRHYGDYGGLSRIWFASIAAYADRYEISGDDFQTFETLIRELDAEFVEIETARQKEEAERNKQQKD